MKENILDRLTTEGSFLQVFDDLERLGDGCLEVPRKKIGHIRADHNGHRWWNTVWPCHKELATKEIAAEIDQVYEALTAKDALKDLPALICFCKAHPEACVDREFQNEYNFYLEGETCNFWIRLITRERDNNMYLNAFAKDGEPEGEFSPDGSACQKAGESE